MSEESHNNEHWVFNKILLVMVLKYKVIKKRRLITVVFFINRPKSYECRVFCHSERSEESLFQ